MFDWVKSFSIDFFSKKSISNGEGFSRAMFKWTVLFSLCLVAFDSLIPFLFKLLFILGKVNPSITLKEENYNLYMRVVPDSAYNFLNLLLGAVVANYTARRWTDKKFITESNSPTENFTPLDNNRENK